MILATGEYPFIFKRDGICVRVDLPAEAKKYFTPQEMKAAKQLLMETENTATSVNGDLSKKLFQARQDADKFNQSRAENGTRHKDKEKHL